MSSRDTGYTRPIGRVPPALITWWYGATTEPPPLTVTLSEPKPNGVPWAHIAAGNGYTLCNSHLPILTKESFAFQDAAYAAKHYTKVNKYLQACPECLEAWAARK
jgi:hypothetical protein